MVLSLDLGRRTGFQLGRAGEMPIRGGAWTLGPPGDWIKIPGNLGCALRDLSVMHQIDMMVIEDFLHPEQQRSGDAVISQLHLHGAAKGFAGPMGITVATVNVASVRKHFIGMTTVLPPVRGRKRTPKEARDARAATKGAVVKRAIQLGYLSTYDEDKADASAIYDYYLSAVMWMPPKNQPFKLFGE